MFHPVGHQPPTVYWRRRFVLLAALVAVLVLVSLTVDAMRSDGSSTPLATTSSSTTRTAAVPAAALTTTPTVAPTTVVARSSTSAATTVGSSSAAASISTPPPTPTCTVRQLRTQSVVGATTYRVGDKPLLAIQVLNTSTTACVQDLADRQIEMRVYNGESRVWGSHDCEIQPGTSPRTLAPNVPVRVTMTWSGLTSQPGCKGTRQRAGAGAYTLYSSLGGKTGTAAQFSIS